MLDELLKRLKIKVILENYGKCRRCSETNNVYMSTLEISSFSRKAGVSFMDTYSYVLSHELGHAILYAKGGDHRSETLAWEVGEKVYKYLYGESPPPEFYVVREVCLSYH